MKKRCLVFLLFVSLLSSAPFASALGLSPPSMTIDFAPFKIVDTSIHVINTDQKPINGSIRFNGALAQHVSTSKKSAIIPPGNSVEFPIHLELPHRISPPGKNAIIITASGSPVGGVQGVGAVVSIAGHLFIDVPFPGKYVDYIFFAPSVNQGEPIPITFHVTNKGLENLFNVKPHATFYETSEKKTALLEQSGKANTLNVGETEMYELTFDSSKLDPGAYFVDLHVSYDGKKSVSKNRTVNVGHEHMDIINYTKKINASSIQKFVVILKNQWNKPFDNVHIDVGVTKDGVPILPVALSQSIPFAPWEVKEIPVFLDFTSLKKGSYEAEITLHYGDITRKEIVPLQALDLFVLETSMIVGLAIALLILADILWMLFIGKHNDKDSKKVDKREEKLNKL